MDILTTDIHPSSCGLNPLRLGLMWLFLAVATVSDIFMGTFCCVEKTQELFCVLRDIVLIPLKGAQVLKTKSRVFFGVAVEEFSCFFHVVQVGEILNFVYILYIIHPDIKVSFFKHAMLIHVPFELSWWEVSCSSSIIFGQDNSYSIASFVSENLYDRCHWRDHLQEETRGLVKGLVDVGGMCRLWLL